MNTQSTEITDCQPFVEWISSLTSAQEAREIAASRADHIAAAYRELLRGHDFDLSAVLTPVAPGSDFPNIICERNVQFVALCRHHFLPFFGCVHLAYEPGKFIVGLGKVSRFINILAARLQFQERLTRDICEQFMTLTQAKGVYVFSQARHICMCARGPRDQHAEATCIFSTGSLASRERHPEVHQLMGLK